MATLRGENKITLNQTTMREILAEWLNGRSPNDPDVDVTDVYLDGLQQFTLVVREKDVAPAAGEGDPLGR